MKNKKIRKPLLFKEGLGRLILACCTIFFCTASVFAQSYDSCALLKEWEYRDPLPGDTALARQQYDSLKLYVEKCAAIDSMSYTAFGNIDGAVQLYAPDDTTRYDRYRDWLISVLYLNTTRAAYFCSCMGSIAGTYQYGKYHVIGDFAVINYLRYNHKECWNQNDEKEYSTDSTAAAQAGYDITHLPPLDSLGLGFLLKDAVSSGTSPLSSQYLASFTTSPNPFIGETSLEFTLNRMSYVTLAIYDELGRLVWGDGRGSSLDAGTHEVHIDGRSLPSGTLYVRIATGFGEVKTVKLVHEK